MSDHAPDPALAVFGSSVPIPANRTVFQEDEQIREVWHVAAGALKVWVWGSGGPSLVDDGPAAHPYGQSVVLKDQDDRSQPQTGSGSRIDCPSRA